MKLFFGILTYSGYQISRVLSNNLNKKQFYEGIFIRRNNFKCMYKENPKDILVKFKDYEVEDFKKIYDCMKKRNITLPLTFSKYIQYTDVNKEVYILDIFVRRLIFENLTELEKFVRNILMVFWISIFMISVYKYN